MRPVDRTSVFPFGSSEGSLENGVRQNYRRILRARAANALNHAAKRSDAIPPLLTGVSPGSPMLRPAQMTGSLECSRYKAVTGSGCCGALT